VIYAPHVIRSRASVPWRPLVVSIALVLPSTSHADTPPAPTGASGTASDSGSAATPSALVAARELFRQAGEDADAGRFAVALEKYRRVAQVKETAQVRYNIARCEEQLGQIASALADYEAAQNEATGDASGEIGATSKERATVLRPRVPRITLVAPIPEPPNFIVRLDGALVANSTFGVPLPADPGRHRLEASAGGREPFVRELELREKESVRVPLTLEASASASASVSTNDGGSQRTWGYVAVGGGVILGAASVIFTLAHNSKVSDILNECPNGQCPHASFADATSAHSAASTDAALAVAFGIGGVVAVGAGVALVLTAPKASTAVALRPGAPGAPAGMSLGGSF
jgi:hypothetical protein